ncbi:nitrate- and nitrite sensing domain-containing protein [Nonomuraea ferruginea]
MASGRSIRFKISTLLVIPLVSLVALWGFAASTTSREALNLLKVETFWTGIIDHADFLVVNLQAERLASAELLSGAPVNAKKLADARATVDRVRKNLTDGALSENTQAALGDDMKTQLADVFKAVDRLTEIRSKVDSRTLTPHALITEYATIPDAIDRLYAAFTVSTDVELSRQSQALIMAAQVRELLSREHALIVAGNAVPGGDGWTMAEIHLLAKHRRRAHVPLPQGHGQPGPRDAGPAGEDGRHRELRLHGAAAALVRLRPAGGPAGVAGPGRAGAGGVHPGPLHGR